MQAPQVILGPSGLPIWQCDPDTGNTIQSGNAVVTDLVLATEPAPSAPAPGFLKLYSPDGQAVSVLNAADQSALLFPGPAYAAVAGTGQTVTGVTAETVLAAGITVPAGGLAAGQAYRFTATGTITTTADTQTIDLRLRYGGLTGTLLFDFGSQNPDNSAAITGASWRAQFDIILTSATTVVVSAQDALNFFPSSVGSGSPVTVSAATAKQLVITVQPSATAVDMVCTGLVCERVA